MEETVIVSYARTPFGKLFGALSARPAVELGALVIAEAVRRAGIAPETVDNVVMGMVVPAGAGQIPSRQATIKAGLPETVPSETINKVCASSLRAVALADMSIKAGDSEVVIAGGMENMSLCPYLLPGVRRGMRMGEGQLKDSMLLDGLWCAFDNVHMGVHGEVPAREFAISREDMDSFACRSHERAVRGQRQGLFTEEIVPVPVADSKKPENILRDDESPRADCTLGTLSSLPPAFTPNGTITAGNAPPVNDGASALVLMSRSRAEALGLEPMATILARGTASREPRYIATVPFFAAGEALARAGLTAADLDLIEVNEAFAGVALTAMKMGRWPEEIVNVNGGAVAIGHPIGASGGRILMTLVAELRRRGGGTGLATICSGAAQGEAIIVRV